MSNELPCGCILNLVVEAYEVDHAEIIFCPLHEASPDMAAALKVALPLLTMEDISLQGARSAIAAVRAALQRAGAKL